MLGLLHLFRICILDVCGLLELVKVFLLFSVTFSHGITNEWRALGSMLEGMLQSQGSDWSAGQA